MRETLLGHCLAVTFRLHYSPATLLGVDLIGVDMRDGVVNDPERGRHFGANDV